MNNTSYVIKWGYLYQPLALKINGQCSNSPGNISNQNFQVKKKKYLILKLFFVLLPFLDIEKF